MLENSLPDSGHDGGHDGRTEARTQLFVSATLSAGDVEHAVKIRDLSAEGAQIEGSPALEVGSAITLVRGRLKVQGHVSWSTARRCGLHFLSRVSVQDWLANPVNREQPRVDSLVAVAKSGAMPPAMTAKHEPAAAVGVADDLMRVSQLLAMLGDALAGDPAIVTRHDTILQSIDIALQTLVALSETMQADAPERAASGVRLAELRISCAEALRAKT